MKNLLTISILLLAASSLLQSASAQSLAEAKTLYEKGAYQEAKPAFKRLVKTQPSNGNYCLWYGVCCLETGEAQEGLKYLQTAVKRRTPSGQYQLARCYDRLYRYEESISELEDYIAELKRRRRSTDKADSLLEATRTHLRMLKGVEQVEVIDSMVVDKAQLLEHYKLSEESGKLYSYTHYFDHQDKGGNMVYETELGNKIYFSERQEDGHLHILTATKQINSWSRPTLLPENINGQQNADYPFIMADGFTIYYAADGEKSMGGYDIFVTRYHTATDSYLTPENIGMPFNSPYNDYLYAIDEYNNLGWFASDRFQPEGKVCIYLFIPNTTKQVYNYEAMDTQALIQLAQLNAIHQTWRDQERVASARQRLAQLLNNNSSNTPQQKQEFTFVVNDEQICHKIADFRSTEAKQLFHTYRQVDNAYKQQTYQLESMRQRYATGDEHEKQRLRDAILDLEKRIEDLRILVEQKANEVRAAEKETR